MLAPYPGDWRAGRRCGRGGDHAGTAGGSRSTEHPSATSHPRGTAPGGAGGSQRAEGGHRGRGRRNPRRCRGWNRCASSQEMTRPAVPGGRRKHAGSDAGGQPAGGPIAAGGRGRPGRRGRAAALGAGRLPDRNLERVEKLVSNPNFREKARPDVVENEEARLAELRDRQQRLHEILQQLGR